MTPIRYILRSVRHYWFAYLGVLAGTILGATVLFGALFAGDSVTESLRRIGAQRIGLATHVLTAGDRFFRTALADALADRAKVRAAPLVYARGTAVSPATRASANQVQLVGVTEAFWRFAPTPTAVDLDATRATVAVNDTLARRLQVKAGDTLIVRLHRPGILAGNAPVAGAETALQSIRCTVATVVGEESFGRFSLESTQIPPATVFLPLDLLQESLERPNRANLMLLDASERGDIRDGNEAEAMERLTQALADVVTLADYGLSLTWLEQAGAFEIASDRIFIDPELARSVRSAVPGAQPVLSYLVNAFRVRDRTTPYSIATATTPEAAPFLPVDLRADEIVLNDWLAEDLEAGIGDDVRLTYFQAGTGDSLVEQNATLRVRAIIRLEGLAADRAWMPAFPGISDARRTSDWDPGLPLDLDRIRPKDEAYWDAYRGTPKAFVSFAAGEAHWSTRWGSQTALRVPFERAREAELTETLLGALHPSMNQLLVRNIRAEADRAAQSPVDFGGLFLGLSFFLILAALGLVAMLFNLSLLQRNREDALLGAVGVSATKLLRWRLAEALLILLGGGAIGLVLATAYTRGILRFLESIWAGQGAASTFVFAARPGSIAAGSVAFLMLSLGAIWFSIRRQRRRSLSIRLAANIEDPRSPETIRRRSYLLAAIALIVGGTAIALSDRGLPVQAAFYLAGFALLVAGIAVCRGWMAGSSALRRDPLLTPDRLGALNVRTRRSRSLTVVGMIAAAVFMVLSVASFRKHVGGDWLNRDSGTGGFAFWAETTAPQNPARDGTAGGFELFERHAAELGELVPLRAGVGDNINCFNLNSSAQPKLLAVDAAKLAARNAFRVKPPGSDAVASGWTLLQQPVKEAIPAFVDETTLLWALKRKVGDVLTYADENGRNFPVQIVGTLPDSIFQGYLVVDEQAFLQRFPSNPGYSVFLIEARDPRGIEALRSRLEATLRDVGGRVDTTRDVLAAFHQIENTYIAIFNVLGSLGVLLGSLGLTIVVARNLRERRDEFAVMTAIGIPPPILARVVYSEFGRLVLWGIGIGVIASVIAVWPGLTVLPAAPIIGLVAVLLLGIVLLNLFAGWLVFRWSMRDLRPQVMQAAG